MQVPILEGSAAPNQIECYISDGYIEDIHIDIVGYRGHSGQEHGLSGWNPNSSLIQPTAGVRDKRTSMPGRIEMGDALPCSRAYRFFSTSSTCKCGCYESCSGFYRYFLCCFTRVCPRLLLDYLRLDDFAKPGGRVIHTVIPFQKPITVGLPFCSSRPEMNEMAQPKVQLSR